MASESDTEEFYDAPEDVHLGGSYPVGSPGKVGLLSFKETKNTGNKAGNESPVQELRQDVSKKIIECIIEESQKVLQLEDDSLDSKGKGLSDQATASHSVAGTEFSNIPGLLAIQHELQQGSRKADSQNAAEETELETQKCFPSDNNCEKSEKTEDETNNLTEVSSADQLDASKLETEILNKEAVEVKEGDVVNPASSDALSTKDFAAVEEVAPAKPPRHLTPEPDIVASTKKPVPARPPPPTNFPPPRPPPPSRPAPPPRKKKSDLEFEALKTPDLDVPKDNIASDSLLTTNMASESTVRDSLPSLDLASATSGDKIVTAQENGKAPDVQTVAGEVMGPQRPRSNSGRELTDEEILASVMIKNLDTGEEIPLSLAEEKLPTGINPLTLHIMRRTKEYVRYELSNDATQSDDEEKLQSQQTDTDGGRLKQKTTQLKKFLGKSVKRAKHLAEEYGERAINKVKSVRDEVFHTDQDDPSSSDDEGMPYTRPVKFKAAHGFKGPYDFDQIKVVQDLSGEHMGAVWTMKFSHCGRLLASAGQDNIVRIWALKNAFDYFNNMRMKYNTEGRVSPSPSQESLSSSKSDTDMGVCSGTDEDPDDKNAPFRQRPFCKYKGHTADLLDLSWSKNYFLLSSSMDKTVRLWHISRRECLCCFQHIDFVTAIAFHPRDDRYFLSGSLDGKLRLWNIPDKKVALWNEVDGQTKLITAANFCQNGKYAVIGTYDGRCIFYDTEHLKYHTQIHVRSTRGRNKVGRKITGIEPLPGENKILVTSNDSRIRLYDLRDLSLSMKYKGYVNSSSQIKASFSHDFTYLVSGSEDKYVYIWSTYHDLSKFTSVRRDRNDFWEGIKAHNAVVTSAIFAPNPSLMLSLDVQSEKLEGIDKYEDAEVLDNTSTGIVKTDNTEVLLSADFTGAIKVFINKRKTVS
ncbi:WD repeat-containing protein 44 isoform X1 [Rattus norvegicus]|uniref:WD repeat-containing protein 44 n=1 Tax=Rattus norvegicus TaxID=10116 RepID=A0A0G2K7S6_RAT|nr:WD repeat-containing protein 44 isoform X1 [Rattus norvegicus]XP_038955377.1 WD repeat-containing protein 44 isoform X1 [Rattus norvegicus]XP_038955378.1 WD repeat-containing protein 44 isoform X1 [Rattus norvegicus]|eukprot:XP_006257504.1 PREDICTED: WD repeat-containing protein 44 isoform X1 [Rattus norvegicus]